MIKFKRLHEDAKTPVRGSTFSSGLDIASIENVVIPPGASATIKTGLAFEISRGKTGFIWPRSKLGAKLQIQVLAGVIDSDYRGEVMVALLNSGKQDFEVFKGDKIAQLLIQDTPRYNPIEVEELSETDRGKKGINSTEMRVRS